VPQEKPFKYHKSKENMKLLIKLLMTPQILPVVVKLGYMTLITKWQIHNSIAALKVVLTSLTLLPIVAMGERTVPKVLASRLF